MTHKTSIGIVMLLAVAWGTGCSDDGVVHPSGADGPLSASHMAEVALQSDLLAEQILDAELRAMDGDPATNDTPTGTVTREVTFSRTRPCPGDGEFHLEGTIRRTFEFDTVTMEAECSGLRSRTDCTFPRGDMTVTVNGQASWEIFRRKVEHLPDGPQTGHFYGSVSALRSDGEERACEYDVSIVRDPDTHTRTLDGVICGTEVHRSVTWSRGE
jgi:hypothetical protein